MKNIVKTLVLFFAITFFDIQVFAQGVNTTGGVSLVAGDQAPHPSAMLDIISTNKGVLLPRLDSAQRMAINPRVEGLLVFDMTKQAFYYVDKDLCWRELENHKYSNAGTNSCVDQSSGKVPVGGIIMFNGPLTNNFVNGLGVVGTQYEGWAICNGLSHNSHPTPDLTSRFIVGAKDPNSGPGFTGSSGEQAAVTYSRGDNGGLNMYKLSATQSGSPAHDHILNGSIAPGATMNYTGWTKNCLPHTHDFQIRRSGTKVGTHSEPEYGRGEIQPDGTTKPDGIHNHEFEINGQVNLSGTITGTSQQNTATDATDAHENRPPYFALYYIIRLW